VTTSLPSARAGDAYAAAFDAAGGDAATYQWTISELPPGLVDHGGGAFGGTPTAPGATLVKASVTASGKDGVPTTDTKRLQLVIADKSNAVNPDIAEARGWLMPLLAALVPVLAGFVMTKLGDKEQPEEQQEQEVAKAQELAEAARVDVPPDQQAMAQSIESEAVSREVALEQLARKREVLVQHADALDVERDIALHAHYDAEREIQSRDGQWSSFMERYFAEQRAAETRQAVEEVEERRNQNLSEIDAVDAAADELDPKGKAEMFPDRG
jgi:hypothetical protein